MQYGKLLCKNNITKYLATSEGNEAIQKGRGRKSLVKNEKWLVGNRKYAMLFIDCFPKLLAGCSYLNPDPLSMQASR
jgi:hypothetical protein